jgi:hypothetical protein
MRVPGMRVPGIQAMAEIDVAAERLSALPDHALCRPLLAGIYFAECTFPMPSCRHLISKLFWALTGRW